VQVRGPARRCSGSGARGTVHGRVGSGSGAGQLARPYETVKSMNSKGRTLFPHIDILPESIDSEPKPAPTTHHPNAIPYNA
jgi:hypothetical protein